MSASYVRDKIRTWAATASTASLTAFHDTVNIEVKPAEDVWFSVGFGVDFNEGTFCTPGYIENGLITVVVFGRAGTGDIDSIKAMELIIPSFMAQVDPSGRLSLQSYEPIREASKGSADNYYRVEVAINYIHEL